MIGREAAIESLRWHGHAAPATEEQQRARYLLAAILVIGACLRIWQLGSESLWNDEGFSWWWSQQSYADLWGAKGSVETNPPLYYSLQRLWRIFGDSEVALRSIAVLFGTLTIPLTYLIGRIVGGRQVGLLAAALLATSAVHVYYSQEARAYTLFCAAAMLAVLGLLWFLRAHSTPRWWPADTASPAKAREEQADFGNSGLAGLVLYTVGTTVALYAHNTAIFLAALASLVAAGWWLGCAGRSRRFLLSWLVANLIPLIAWLYWLPVVLAQSDSAATIGWIKQPTITWAAHDLLRMYGLRYLRDPPWLDVIAPIYLLGLVGLVSWRHRLPVVLALLTFVAGVPLLVYLGGLLGRPLWVERTVLWPLPLGLVIVAAGMAAVRTAQLRMAVAVLVFAAHAVNLAAYYGATQKPSMASAATRIAQSWRPGDGILLVNQDMQWPLAYYLVRNNRPLVAVSVDPLRDGLEPYKTVQLHPIVPPFGQPVEHIPLGALAELPGRYERVWVLLRRRQTTDPGERVMRGLLERGRIVEQQHHAPGLDLILVAFGPQRS